MAHITELVSQMHETLSDIHSTISSLTALPHESLLDSVAKHRDTAVASLASAFAAETTDLAQKRAAERSAIEAQRRREDEAREAEADAQDKARQLVLAQKTAELEAQAEAETARIEAEADRMLDQGQARLATLEQRRKELNRQIDEHMSLPLPIVRKAKTAAPKTGSIPRIELPPTPAREKATHEPDSKISEAPVAAPLQVVAVAAEKTIEETPFKLLSIPALPSYEPKAVADLQKTMTTTQDEEPVLMYLPSTCYCPEPPVFVFPSPRPSAEQSDATLEHGEAKETKETTETKETKETTETKEKLVATPVHHFSEQQTVQDSSSAWHYRPAENARTVHGQDDLFDVNNESDGSVSSGLVCSPREDQFEYDSISIDDAARPATPPQLYNSDDGILPGEHNVYTTPRSVHTVHSEPFIRSSWPDTPPDLVLSGRDKALGQLDYALSLDTTTPTKVLFQRMRSIFEPANGASAANNGHAWTMTTPTDDDDIFSEQTSLLRAAAPISPSYSPSYAYSPSH